MVLHYERTRVFTFLISDNCNDASSSIIGRLPPGDWDLEDVIKKNFCHLIVASYNISLDNFIYVNLMGSSLVT